MKFYLQIFDLKAEEFIISMNAKIMRNPPLSDENSDLLPYKTFISPLLLTSSGIGNP